MARPKGQTLQQRFGFNNSDLTTPKHDEIMLWLDENIEAIIAYLFVDAKSKKPSKVIEVIWEKPIQARSGFIIGFVDMLVRVQTTRRDYNVNHDVCFEVKTKIPSLGEMIRQINMYRTVTKEAIFVIVAPDDRFKIQLERQDIKFIKYEV